MRERHPSRGQFREVRGAYILGAFHLGISEAVVVRQEDHQVRRLG